MTPPLTQPILPLTLFLFLFSAPAHIPHLPSPSGRQPPPLLPRTQPAPRHTHLPVNPIHPAGPNRDDLPRLRLHPDPDPARQPSQPPQRLA